MIFLPLYSPALDQANQALQLLRVPKSGFFFVAARDVVVKGDKLSLQIRKVGQLGVVVLSEFEERRDQNIFVSYGVGPRRLQPLRPRRKDKNIFQLPSPLSDGLVGIPGSSQAPTIHCKVACTNLHYSASFKSPKKFLE